MKIKFLTKQKNFPPKKVLIKQKNKIKIISMTLALSVLLTEGSNEAKFLNENMENISYEEKLNKDLEFLKKCKKDFFETIYSEFSENKNKIDIYLEYERNKKVVSLTFDDGPSQYTDELIDILNKNNVKATFFVIGCNISKYEDTLIKLDEEGYEIGIHGYSHSSFIDLNTEETQKEIDMTEEIINNLGIIPSNLVRPPYGAINAELKSSIDSTFVLWNLDTLDWKTRDKNAIIDEINRSIKDGSVILMHDIYPSSIEAIEEILPLLKENYRFVTVSELNRINELKSEKSNSKVKK